MELLFRRHDGSFVIQGELGPYHVIEADPLFTAAVEAAAVLGDDLPFEATPEPEPPTLDDYRLAIQAHVDATAGQRGYDAGVTCASYIGSTVAQWAAEATAFVAWRDTVWAYAYAELAKVEAAARPQPSIPEIIEELPAIAWPEGATE